MAAEQTDEPDGKKPGRFSQRAIGRFERPHARWLSVFKNAEVFLNYEKIFRATEIGEIHANIMLFLEKYCHIEILYL